MANTPQLNIRVPLELKEAFIQYAKDNNTTATDLIIGFMQQCLGMSEESPRTLAVVDSASIQTQLQQLASRVAALEGQQMGKRTAA